jgi:hypothetical protein
VVAAVEVVVEGVTKMMKHGLGIPETFGTPSSHYAYDSCAQRRYVSRRSTSPMKTSHNPSSSFLCIRSACEVHEVEKRRLGHRRSADFRVLFAFFDAGNLASPASAHRSQGHFYQSANVRGKSKTHAAARLLICSCRHCKQVLTMFGGAIYIAGGY